jgi:hypothetical protein
VGWLRRLRLAGLGGSLLAPLRAVADQPAAQRHPHSRPPIRHPRRGTISVTSGSARAATDSGLNWPHQAPTVSPALPAVKTSAQSVPALYLGAQIIHTMAPYLTGMYSVLWTLELFRMAARQRVVVPIDIQYIDDTILGNVTTSLAATPLDPHDCHSIEPNLAIPYFQLEAKRKATLYLRPGGGAQAEGRFTQRTYYLPVSTEHCRVGWYEGGTQSFGGRLLILPFVSAARSFPADSPPEALFSNWESRPDDPATFQYGHTAWPLDLFPSSWPEPADQGVVPARPVGTAAWPKWWSIPKPDNWFGQAPQPWLPAAAGALEPDAVIAAAFAANINVD